MAINLFNTLGKEKQEFTPFDKKLVRMYSCGPTVYNVAHIGNLRAYVFADILKRALEYNDYKVKHVMNVTDIGHLTSDADDGDDKMVKALKREGKPMTLPAMREIADKYFALFQSDLEKLNIEMPSEFPFASDHINEDVEMIETLMEKGFAYKISDGIYFDTSKLPDYGRLGGISNENISRIEGSSEKISARDFALWKFADASGIGFDALFGKGFPGWHIECSAMSEKYLGVPFDIHTGGIDHIPVHHNNEIAQTEAAEGKLLANYWLHNEHITIRDAKMAKSGDNFLTLKYLEEQGISTLAYRYWLLTARYSTRMDFSLEAIKAAQAGFRNNFEAFMKHAEKVKLGNIVKAYREKFLTAINDDLDTPKAIVVSIELLNDTLISVADKKATILDFDRVLGLRLEQINTDETEILAELEKLVSDRQKARDEKDWQKADELRMAINKAGFEVKDTSSGQVLTRI